MKRLFDKKDFRIVRLGGTDAKGLTDHFATFRQLVLENEPAYPGIDRWFKDKVVPGLRSSERVALVGYLKETPVVSAVVKRGDDSKFCHLRIHDDVQDANLGEVFFALMAFELRQIARTIHFTLPEGLWESKQDFFRSFNFCEAKKAGTQYR